MSYALDWPRDYAVAPTAETNALPSMMDPGLAYRDAAGLGGGLAEGLPLGRPDKDDDTTSDIVWTLAYWPWL
jgi:hypothetical protein